MKIISYQCNCLKRKCLFCIYDTWSHIISIIGIITHYRKNKNEDLCSIDSMSDNLGASQKQFRNINSMSYLFFQVK